MPWLTLQLYARKKNLRRRSMCSTSTHQFIAFNYTPVPSSYHDPRTPEVVGNKKNPTYYMHFMFPIWCICIIPNRWWKGIERILRRSQYIIIVTGSSIMLLLPYIIISQGRLVRALVHIEYSIWTSLFATAHAPYSYIYMENVSRASWKSNGQHRT